MSDDADDAREKADPWCDDCMGYTHRPDCPSAQEKPPAPDLVGEPMTDEEAEDAISAALSKLARERTTTLDLHESCRKTVGELVEALVEIVKKERMKYRYPGTRPSPGWTACENIERALLAKHRKGEK